MGVLPNATFAYYSYHCDCADGIQYALPRLERQLLQTRGHCANHTSYMAICFCDRRDCLLDALPGKLGMTKIKMKTKSGRRDPFGFLFWLKWILWFAGTFVLASLFWTYLISKWMGPIQGNELTLTWAFSVFGSWFLLMIPFIRKKEQIWKRLNQDQEKAVDAWLRGMGGLIGLVVVSCLVWSAVYGDEFQKSVPWHAGWVKSVLVTGMVVLMPCLIWMYRKADQIMKGAMERQMQNQPRFQTAFVERAKRVLPSHLAQKISKVPPFLENGHLVTMIMKNGERIPHVFVLKSKEILGVYDRSSYDIQTDEIDAVEVADGNDLPDFEESKWLRIDGRV